MKYITIILLLFTLTSQGQSTYFDLAFVEEDTLNFYTIEFVQDLKHNDINNKYYICGSYQDRNEQLILQANPLLYILDEQGNLEQKLVYYQDTTTSLFTGIEVDNEYIFLTGRTDETGLINSISSDYFLAKTDLEGNLLNFTNHGTLAINDDTLNNEGLLSFTNSFENGFINCGVRFTTGTNSASIWINKIAGDSIVWETIIDNPNLIDVAVDIESNKSDSTYIVYTEQEEFVNGDYVQHIILLKIDEQGNIVAQSPNLKTDENVNGTLLKDMAIDDESNIIIVGAKDTGESFICKLDSSFNVIWDTYVQKYENEILFTNNCLVAADGNYVVSGSVGTPDTEYNNENELFGFIMKYDAQTGDTLWYKELIHYDSETGTSGRQHYVEAMTLAPDSGFLLGGYVFYYGNLPQVAWLRKVDKNGCSEFNCGLPVGTNDNFEETQIEISPNPAKEFLTINSTNVYLETYQITNVLGEIVQQNTFAQNINIQKLTKGVYFINFNNSSKVHKFIKM